MNSPYRLKFRYMTIMYCEVDLGGKTVLKKSIFNFEKAFDTTPHELLNEIQFYVRFNIISTRLI